MARALACVLGVALSAALTSGPAAADDTRFSAGLDHLRAGSAAEAVRAFQALADEGHGLAQINLAILYARGDGVPLNTLEAAFWSEQARLMGEGRAIALSDALRAALPAQSRNTIADRLTGTFEAVAEAGTFQAFIALGRVEMELRAPPREADAAEWLLLAAAFEVPKARPLRDALLQKLPDAERLRVEAAARDAFFDWCARVMNDRRPASCPASDS